MSNVSKNIKTSTILIFSVALLTFIIPILLLTKAINVTPNAEFAHLLLYFSIPITIGTLLFQLVFFKLKVKKALKTEDNEEKKDKLQHVFLLRMLITLVAIIPNFVFLTLTNFDMFLVINIVLLLWLINIFPFTDKIKRLFGDI